MNLSTGTLVSFDPGTFLATVRLRGSGAQALSGVPTSRAIDSAEMIPGRTALVHVPPGAAPGAAMLIAITG